MKTHGVLDGGQWSASRPGHFIAGEITPGARWVGGWVGPRTRLDAIENRNILTLPGIEPGLSCS
jgi:hypothetical protein